MSKVKYHPLPCPFCGSEVEVTTEYYDDKYTIRHPHMAVVCPLNGRSFSMRRVRAACVKAWNKRAEVKP